MPVPNSSIYQPQQQAPYISTQSTQPPFTHQTFTNPSTSASAHAPSPPHPSVYSHPSGPVSHTPPAFPTPFVPGGHTPTNSGPPLPSTPPRAGTMPLPNRHYNVPESNVTRPQSHLWMQQEPQLVTGDWGPRVYILYDIHPNMIYDRLLT